MYLDYYGLEKDPFHITPDPAFFYLSPSHREAYATIAYGIDQRKGFVLLTGEVGLGKTTVLRTYLEQANHTHLDCLYLFNPDLSYPQLLRLLLHEMKFDAGAHPTTPWMLRWVHYLLVKRYRAGRNVALIIDEAQHMPAETLEGLRMLSNLETSCDKLIQLVLVGQPELDEKLQHRQLRALRQRIVLRATIRPLTAKESVEYMKHRVGLAGGELQKLFATSALRRIVTQARGIPRRLNILAGNTLMASFGAQRRPAPGCVVREVIRDLDRKASPAALKSVLTRLAWRFR